MEPTLSKTKALKKRKAKETSHTNKTRTDVVPVVDTVTETTQLAAMEKNYSVPLVFSSNTF